MTAGKQKNFNFDEPFQTVALRQIEGRQMRIRLTKKNRKKERKVSEIKGVSAVILIGIKTLI